MLNPELFLNEKVFNEPEKKSTRAGFGSGLVKAAQANNNVVALTADLRDSLNLTGFAKKFPERFFDCGVAEQNMVTVASGLAASGKIPFCASYATFSPGRNWEQIRTTIAYNNVPVKIVGGHAGLQTGPDGATHQALEDLALMRVLPNMEVISPCDYFEAEKATLALAKSGKPGYLRLFRPDFPVLTTEKTPFSIGKIEKFWVSEKPQVTILACGDMVYQSLVAVRELEEKHSIQSEVLNVATIKPLDLETILASVKKTNFLVTVEDHQVAGGMGSAVLETLAGVFPIKTLQLGLNDQFGQSGTPDELLKEYGLSAGEIEKKISEFINI